MSVFHTPLCSLLRIRHPILQAGMHIAGAELAGAVANAGGLGVIGALHLTPTTLRREIRAFRAMTAPGAPLGVDLLLPKLGGGARATNVAYTKNRLREFIDVLVEEHVSVLVCAVGLPSAEVVQRCKQHNILYIQLVGKLAHAARAIAHGADVLVAQGAEGGGHTGDVATTTLLPEVVDCAAATGTPVVAAGGVCDGRGLVMALAFGAQGVWVGTRFALSEEANLSEFKQKSMLRAASTDTICTEVYTGRPLRVLRNGYIEAWHTHHPAEMALLLRAGVVPVEHDLAAIAETDEPPNGRPPPIAPILTGQATGRIREVLPAKDIVVAILESAAVAAARIARGPRSRV